jgi:hypothetical protein
MTEKSREDQAPDKKAPRAGFNLNCDAGAPRVCKWSDFEEDIGLLTIVVITNIMWEV